MADRIFYTLYRFFEGMHGPGGAAEVAALFTWSCLLFSNVAAILVLLLVASGNPPALRGYIPYTFGVAGTIIMITQGTRYLARDHLQKLYETFGSESSSLRSRRQWISFGYLTISFLLFVGSLWLLGAVATS